MAMWERIIASATDQHIDASLRAELDLISLVLDDAFLAPRADTEMRALFSLSPRDDRDVLAFITNDQSLQDDDLDELRRFPDRFRTGRPATRYFMLWSCGRTLTFRGRLDDASELVTEIADLAATLDSKAIRIAAMELRAQIARVEENYDEFCRLMDRVVADRTGYLESGFFTILARFHRVYAHASVGRALPATDIRRAWDAVRRNAHSDPMWHAACATAAWLTIQDRSDLALRFLRWATGITESNPLPYFADLLDDFGLPTEPGSSDESIDDLLDELDFL